jgi:hypothetical protein
VVWLEGRCGELWREGISMVQMSSREKNEGLSQKEQGPWYRALYLRPELLFDDAMRN